MSLYGSLYSSVSGLKSQGAKIGIVSDNISNVNTVGYKQASAQFETLVTSTANTTTYSPGGAIGGNRQLVDKQGLLQATDSPTDIAISGSGFFVVSKNSDGSGLPLFTRAGSFRQDNLGNFVNASGFFLRGWPLDRDGRLPGEPGNLNTVSNSNLDSLVTVNVESSNGVASATTTVRLGANLDAGEVIYPGAGADGPFDPLSTVNASNKASDIIATNEYSASPTNSIVRGDRFTVTTGSGFSYTYTLGGFTIGRDITSSVAGGNGDGANAPTSLVGGGASQFDSTNGSSTVTVTTNGAHNLGPVGHVRTIVVSGYVAGDLAGTGLTPAQVNGTRTVTITGANTYNFTAGAVATGTVSVTPLSGTAAQSDFAGNILDATTASQVFFSSNSTANFTSAARTFTITTATTGTVTFSYTASSPNTLSQQFNNLNTLASAIDSVNGLTARVVNNRLYVGSEDANEAVTFANGDATGSGTLGGIDWVAQLDLQNITSSTGRYSNLQGLANLVNASAGVSATVTNPLSDSTIRIYNDDPLDTIRLQDYTGTTTTLGLNPITVPAGAPGPKTVTIAQAGHTFQIGDNIVLNGAAANNGLTAGEQTGTFTIVGVVAGVSYDVVMNSAAITTAGAGGGAAVTVADTNVGSVLAELGIVTSLNGAAYTVGDTGSLGPEYDSSGTVGNNMASGNITAQFSRNVRIYDALGSGHDLRMSFLKVASNTWAVEVHAIPETDVSTTLSNGQVAVGTITFNGDGSLRSVSNSLVNPVTITWTNGSVPSTVDFNLGTAGQPFGTTGATSIGLTDGLSQFDSDYNVAFVEQNGSPVGQLVGVTIDENGFVIATYSNGESQRVYKLPLADFANPNGLQTITGNVFAQTQDSGEVNLREAGENGVGNIQSASLEASNVELAEQLTDLIVAQRAYQANTRVISTTDQLLQALNQLGG